MTAATAIQKKQTGPSTLLHTLTLACAALTLVFALLSIILGNRLSTLQTQLLKSKIATATSEAASIQDMEATLKATMDKIETTQKSLDGEKAAAERHRKQLAGVMKDLEKAKADLAIANQIITRFKSTDPSQPAPTVATPEPATSPGVAPSMETVLPQPPTPQSSPQQGESSKAQSAPIQIPTGTPAKITPEPSATQTPATPAVNPESNPVTTTLPATAPLSPENPAPVTEETILETPPTTAAPVAD
jgi:flagellar hook-basal body complex protein FliE